MDIIRVAVRVLAAIVVIGSGAIFGLAAPASACSCIGPLAWIEESGGPGVIFSGEVIEVRDLGTTNEFGEGQLEMTFKVDTVYRGDVRDHVFVRSQADSGANCGFSGGVGRWMVLADLADGDLRTDGCSVAGLDEAGTMETELQALVGLGREPVAVDPDVVDSIRAERRTTGSSVSWPAVAGGIAMVGILGLGLIVIVRTERSGR